MKLNWVSRVRSRLPGRAMVIASYLWSELCALPAHKTQNVRALATRPWRQKLTGPWLFDPENMETYRQR